MKDLNIYYEALRLLSRNEFRVQEAWEKWNNLKWETEFDFDRIKECDCVVCNDYSIHFVENGWGKTFAEQNGGFVLFERQANDLIEIQEKMEEKMEELKKIGYGSED